jgi:hypothetical protein
VARLFFKKYISVSDNKIIKSKTKISNINFQEYAMKTIILLFFLCGNLFSSNPQNCLVLSVTGKTEIRAPYQTEWKRATEDFILTDRTTIRSYRNSAVKIKTYNGDIFTLPSSAQIEIQQLRKLNRNEVVLELTALDLQKLPLQSDQDKDSEIFILHGAIQDKENNDESQKYISLEINGALALFDQGFIAGFIIKWKKLLNAFPNIKSEKAKQALIESYNIMKMPKRLKDINNSNSQNGSKFIVK